MTRRHGAAGSLMERARRGLRRRGVAGTAVRAIQQPLRQVARDRNVVYVHGGRPEGVRLPPSIEIVRYGSPADVPDGVWSAMAAAEGVYHRDVADQEFARGGVLWIATEQDRLAAAQWSIRGAQLGRWFVELNDDDVVLFAVMAVPAFRARGISSAVSCSIIDRELRPDARAFIDCKVWNAPAHRFAARAGFERVKVASPRVLGVANRLPPPAADSHLVPIEDADSWQRAVTAFADDDYRQSWAWGECSAERVGARSEYRALVGRGDDVQALVAVWVKRTTGVGGIAYVSGGPLVQYRSDDGEGDQARNRLRAALRALVAEYTIGRNLVLRVVPSPGEPGWMEAREQVLAAIGFTPTDRVPRRRTIVVDLDVTDQQLRASLAQKWRNCLNRAEREPVAVRAGSSPELLDEVLPLFDELVARKGFVPGLPATFFARAQRLLPEHSRFHVALADVDGVPVAGQVTAVVGSTAVYVLGASGDLGRRHKAAYLLQWEAMTAARIAGCRSYDLGGIDPDLNPDGYHFKRGMGGVEVEGVGYEIRPPGLAGRVTLAAETAYRRARDVRSRGS